MSMLTNTELNQIRTQSSDNETTLKLVSEIERLKNYVADYTSKVNSKVDAIEKDLGHMEAENNALLSSKEIAYVERDACIGLLVQFAVKSGLSAGTAPGNMVIVDLPSGQVSWEYNESESHLFSGLPAYENKIEAMPLEEKYRRVMNPGINDSAQASNC